MQQIIHIRIAVRQRRSREGDDIARLLRNGEHVGGVFPADTLDLVHLIEDEQRLFLSQLLQNVRKAAHGLIVHKNEIAAAGFVFQRCPAVARALIRRVVNVHHAQRFL